MPKHLFALIAFAIIFIGCGYNKDTKLELLRNDIYKEFNGLSYRNDTNFHKNLVEFLEEHVKKNNFIMDEKEFKNYTNCIWTKSNKTTLSIPLQTCDNEFKNNILMNTQYGNPSYVMGNNSLWDGENSIAKNIIIKSLYIPDSYNFKDSHHAIKDNGMQIAIRTNYTAKNQFGMSFEGSTYILFDQFGNMLYAE